MKGTATFLASASSPTEAAARLRPDGGVVTHVHLPSATLECHLLTYSRGSSQRPETVTQQESQEERQQAVLQPVLLHLRLRRMRCHADLIPLSVLDGHSGTQMQALRLPVIGHALMSAIRSENFAARNAQSVCVSCASCI